MMLTTAQAASRLTQVGVSARAGALVGLERRAAHKDIAVKIFGGVALACTLAARAAPLTAYECLLGLSLLTVSLNVRSLVIDRSLEFTTSMALWAIALLAILIGAGQVGAGAAGALVIVGLLAVKLPLQRVSRAVTIEAVRGALVLGVIALVAYPLLPPMPIGPWRLVTLRTARVAVLAVFGIALIWRRRPTPAR